MEEDKGTAAGASGKQSPPPAQRPEGDRISPARKARLAVLLCLLAGVVIVAVILNRRQQRTLNQLREGLSGAIQVMRDSVRRLDPNKPQDELRLSKAQGLEAWDMANAFAEALSSVGDPEESDARLAEARRLAVALYYADARLDEAIRLFNELDIKQIEQELDPARLQMAQRAFSAFPALAIENADPQIHANGKVYLQDCAILWQIAWRTTGQAETDTEKALRLCRWCALHLMPVEEEAQPAMPAMVVMQGRGSPGQIAWTYADIARQVGLVVDMAILGREGAPQQYLIQVRPSDDEPFLVIPSLGVPVLDPETEELLSLQSLLERPESYAALMALAGQEAPYEAEDFAQAKVKTVVHPYALFSRFQVLAHLLSDLPSAPRLAFEMSSARSASAPAVWDLPFQTLQQLRTPGGASEEQLALLQMTGDPRLRQMRGFYDSADAAYENLARSLQARLARTDVVEAATSLRRMIETVEFFAASNLHDARAWPLAEKRLREHLEAHPTGQWSAMARTLLAESFSASAKSEEAARLWKELEHPRRLYGALRLRDLLPLPPLYQLAPVGLPQSTGPDSDSS